MKMLFNARRVSMRYLAFQKSKASLQNKGKYPLINPKGPKIHDFEMKNSIDRIVKNIIKMRSKFIPSKFMKNIVCVS